MTVLNVVFAIPQEFTRFVQSRGVHLSGILEPIKRWVQAITRQQTKILNKDEYTLVSEIYTTGLLPG